MTKNNKKFHKFSIYRKQNNTIWDLVDKQGNVVLGFQELLGIGVFHFSQLSKEPLHTNMGDIMKIISFFPRLVKDEDNMHIFQ